MSVSSTFKGHAENPPTSSVNIDRRLRRWGLRLATSLALGSVVAYFSIPYILGPVVTVSTVMPRDIMQTVVASGLVQTPYRVSVGSKIVGVVTDVPVAEGQSVTTGDILVRLDDGELLAAVNAAKSSFVEAQSKLRQLVEVAAPIAVETQRQANAAVDAANAAYLRAASLEGHGAGSAAALEESKRALDVAQSQVRAAELQVRSDSPGGMDYMTAQAQVDQAEAQLRAAEASLANATIRASRSGTLISREVERGDIVQPGNVLMSLAPSEQVQIVVEIDEQHLGLLQLGQMAAISADAYSDRHFAARVTYINPSVNAQTGSVEVKLDVIDPPSYLRQDMTVSVDVATGHKTQALAIDTISVHDLAKADPWVWVVEGSRIRQRHISLGLRGDSAIEITGGLSTGDTVLQGSGATIVEGQRVRPKSNG